MTAGSSEIAGVFPDYLAPVSRTAHGESLRWYEANSDMSVLLIRWTVILT
jgi:hypothetical protein